MRFLHRLVSRPHRQSLDQDSAHVNRSPSSFTHANSNVMETNVVERSQTVHDTQQAVAQDVIARYLKKEKLQDLLERLFPGQSDFKIRVCAPYICSAPFS